MGPANSGKPRMMSSRVRVLQAECLESRRIDQVAARIGQVVQPRAGGGVLAHVQRGRVFARGRGGVRHQRVEQRGLAHAALSQQQMVLPARRGASSVWTRAGSSALNSTMSTPSAAIGASRSRAAGRASARSVLFRMMSGEIPALQAPARARPVRSSEKWVGPRPRSAADRRWTRIAWSASRPSGKAVAARRDRIDRAFVAALRRDADRSPTVAPAFLPRGKHCAACRRPAPPCVAAMGRDDAAFVRARR